MGCWKETLTDADNFAINFPEEMELPNKERHQLYRYSDCLDDKPKRFLVCVSSEACFVQYLYSVLRIRIRDPVFFDPWILDPYPGFGMEPIPDSGIGIRDEHRRTFFLRA
jgi:hypothetical protein